MPTTFAKKATAEGPTNQFTAPHVSSSRLRRSEGGSIAANKLGTPARAYARASLASHECWLWKEGVVRSATLSADLRSPPGRSFQTAPPVVIKDFQAQDDFIHSGGRSRVGAWSPRWTSPR